MAEPTVPEDVYSEAAIAYTATAGWEPRIRKAASDPYAQERQFRAAVEVAYRAGRTAASQAIRDHADEHFPADEPFNAARRSFRRHLLAAANVADNPVTLAEAAEALQRHYIACRAEDIEPCCVEFARTGHAHTEACCYLGEDA